MVPVLVDVEELLLFTLLLLLLPPVYSFLVETLLPVLVEALFPVLEETPEPVLEETFPEEFLTEVLLLTLEEVPDCLVVVLPDLDETAFPLLPAVLFKSLEPLNAPPDIRVVEPLCEAVLVPFA